MNASTPQNEKEDEKQNTDNQWYDDGKVVTVILFVLVAFGMLLAFLYDLLF